MSGTYSPPISTGSKKSLLEQAAELGAFFVGDPDAVSTRDVTANGAAIDTLRNALDYEYAGVGANGGRFVLSSDIGSGAHALTLDTTNTLNGYPCFVTSNAGHAAQALATTTQSTANQADIGGLLAKDGPWAKSPFTIIVALRVMANPTDAINGYGGGFILGKKGEENWVLGISRPPARDAFWTGGYTGELPTAIISYPDGAPPTGLLIVSLSYDGYRARWTMNGVDTSLDDGVGASISAISPGFGFSPVFNGLGPASTRIYWFAYFDNSLSLDSIRSIGRLLVNRFAVQTRTSVRFWGDSITAGYCLPEMDSVPLWAGTTLYSNGAVVQNDSGKMYVMTAVAGTSASSGGPTGKGTGITDGTCQWAYIGASSEQPLKPGWPVVATAKLLSSGVELVMDNRGASGTGIEYVQGQRWRLFVEGPLSVTPKRNMGIFSIGIKNVTSSESAETILNRLIESVNGARKVGYTRIGIGTMLTYFGLTAPQEAARVAANQYYRNLAAANGYALFDFATLEQQVLIPKPDGIHPDAAGSATMGNYAAGVLGAFGVG